MYILKLHLSMSNCCRQSNQQRSGDCWQKNEVLGEHKLPIAAVVLPEKPISKIIPGRHYPAKSHSPAIASMTAMLLSTSFNMKVEDRLAQQSQRIDLDEIAPIGRFA